MPSCPTRSSETHVGDSWFPPCRQNGTLGAKIRMRQWARQDPFVRGASFPEVVIDDQPRLDGTLATDLGPALSPGARIPIITRSKAQGCPGTVFPTCFTPRMNAAGMLHSDSVHDRRAQRYRETLQTVVPRPLRSTRRATLVHKAARPGARWGTRSRHPRYADHSWSLIAPWRRL
jgi:hypothetical protein